MNALRTRSILALFLFCTSLGRLMAQTPPPAHHPEQSVEDLGDQSYPVRAAAEQRLRCLGRAALPALERGLKHTDPEVRQRCTALLPLVRRSDLDIELDAFLHNHRDSILPPLPGWVRFQTMVGNDLSARVLYLQIFRRDKDVLELLEKGPDKVAAQFEERLQQFLEITQLPFDEKEQESRTSKFLVLLLTELCEHREQTLLDQFVSNVFDCPLVRAATVNDPALHRLVARIFARQITSLDKAEKYAPRAKSLQLLELLQSHVQSLVEKQVDEAVRSKQIDQLVSAVMIAKEFRCFEMLEAKLKTAVLCVVDQIQVSDDFSELQQAIALCQFLQMTKMQENHLKPAVIRFLFNSADKIKSGSRINEARHLANVVGVTDLLDPILRPAVIKLMAEAADNFNNVQAVEYASLMATNLNMPEVRDSLLLPAARRRILALLEQSYDWDCLSQAVELSKDFNLKEMLDESVKPVLAKYFRNATFEPSNAEKATQMLALAKELQIKEFVPLALTIALARKVNSTLRCRAVQYVGEFGTMEQVEQLETLLKDTDKVKEFILITPWGTTHVIAQMRDVALAFLLLRKGEDPGDYGFAEYQKDSAYSQNPTNLGFADNAFREAAFKKYNELLAKQKK